jgi:hypothetical protein
MDPTDQLPLTTLTDTEYQIENEENEHFKNVRSLMIKMRTHLSQLSTIALPNLSSTTDFLTVDSRSIDGSTDDLISVLESSLSYQNRINRLSLTLHNFNFTVNFWNLLGNIALKVI